MSNAKTLISFHTGGSPDAPYIDAGTICECRKWAEEQYACWFTELGHEVYLHESDIELTEE